MPRFLFLDIESRSRADLLKCGVYVYAADPSTEILIVCYSIDGAKVQTWIPAWGLPMPDDLAAALADPSFRLVAHNASFERVMLSGSPGQRIGFSAGLKSLARWDCTAARAACFGLPRTLAGAGRAAGLDVQKDAEGHRLMLQMCKPRKPRKSEDPDAVYWFDDDARMIRLAEYCARDVEAEVAVWRKLPDLRPDEREAWELTEESNDAGILVDADLLARMAVLVEQAVIKLDAEISDATSGLVPRISDHGALTRWLEGNGIDDAATTGVGKAAIAAMIEDSDLDPFIRSVLCMRRDGGGSASKKWYAIMQRISADGRLRGALVYCGAASTGRWASRGAQVQNLPRGGRIDTDAALRDVLSGASLDTLEFLHGPPLIMAADLLRPAFVAPADAWLGRGDYSQIEARVNPWLAGAEWKLDAFRALDAGTGPDLYRVTAAGILQKAIDAVTKDERQSHGKVPELALGFQGGAGAFLAMAKTYGVRMSRDQAEAVKVGWRLENPEIVEFWYALNDTAVRAMSGPVGVWHDVVTARGHFTRISFIRGKDALGMRLPSGRVLLYWSPRLRDVETPWGEMRPAVVYRSENSVTKQWQEFTGYGGLFCENAVQATARDVMRDAMRRIRGSNSLRLVLTVHDEAIAEALREVFPTAAEAAAHIADLMTQPVAWAPGLPIAVESSAGPRYVKG